MDNLLQELFQALGPRLEGVDLRPAWGPGWGSRLVEGPVLSGEVLSRRQAGGSGRDALRLTLFAPDASALEGAASALEEAVEEGCPGCLGLTRQAQRVDSATGLVCLPLELELGSGGVGGIPVKLGGWDYTAAGAAVTAALSGEALTAVGEEAPFAWRGGAQYQVELSGLHAAGLERMALFTAQVGGVRYTGCRWKQLEPAAGKAVFLAAGCEGEGESA